ncbi:uncharacterized protein [Palaemon carinicauda]|uniref:uncharacterized protein n=1 Tax=Palaemon carinicauda TaxID=392227 RepID=UPI0035B5D1C9
MRGFQMSQLKGGNIGYKVFIYWSSFQYQDASSQAGLVIVTDSSLVLFSDASTVGYGVAAYLVLHGGNQVQSNLVMGKSRVSPKKVVTIPRLELTAATVSVKVAQTHPEGVGVYCWQGSVLHRFNNSPFTIFIATLKGSLFFVANRVRVIRDYSQPEQ